MGKCQTRLASCVNAEEGGDEVDLQMKSTMDSSDGEGEAPMSSSEGASSLPSALSIFHEDILLNILSYVADVPFEMVDRCKLYFTNIINL